jgi:hypothetical protein
VRPQLRSVLVVSRIGGDDHGYWCRHGPVDIRRINRRGEPLFRFFRTDEDETAWTAVRAGRHHPEQIIKLARYVLRDRVLEPRAVRASAGELHIKRFGESAAFTAHRVPSGRQRSDKLIHFQTHGNIPP